jgi:SAM-dependent methyltransferase
MVNSFAEQLRYGWQLVIGRREKHERWLFEMRQKDIAPFLNGSPTLKVLDLANGRLRPQYILLRAAGHNVYGIDLVNRPEHSWVEMSYRLARWLYARNIPINVRHPNSPLICGSVAQLPLASNSFDLVTSIAAFEHFCDIPNVVTEMHRVLQPGGLAWVLVHLFTSLSGGHNISLAETPLRNLPRGVEPWDHLRKRYLTFHVPLNEWRQDQFLETFSQHFEIIKDYCAMREGEEFLTPAIEAELANYRRDELTCGAYVILARKSS